MKCTIFTRVFFCHNLSTSLYSGITNQSGIATVSVIVSGETTFSATYSNVTANCTVTVPNYLFYDDCSADNTSQYTDVTINRSSNTITKSYDSTEQAYKIVGSNGDYFRGLLIPNITGRDNIRISIKVKLATTSAYNQLFIGCTDNIAQTSSSWTGDYFRIRGDNKSDYLHNGGNEVSGSSSTTSVVNKYVTVVFEKNGTTANGKVYDTDGTTVLRTYTYNSMNTYTNPYYVFGMNTRYSNDIKYVKYIKVEPL